MLRWIARLTRRGEDVTGDGVEAARRERKLSEKRLEETQVALIIPLRELRAENHIQPLIAEYVKRQRKRDK
jgi:predicted kinase